jgi:hypothetical protein
MIRRNVGMRINPFNLSIQSTQSTVGTIILASLFTLAGSSYAQARSIYLNGIDISNAQSQDLENVNIRINDNGDIFIIAPHYQVNEEETYMPLSKLQSKSSLRGHKFGQNGSIPQHKKPSELPTHVDPSTMPTRMVTPNKQLPLVQLQQPAATDSKINTEAPDSRSKIATKLPADKKTSK